MLDLDKYVNNSIKMKLFGEEIDVLEPTMNMVMEVGRIEKGMTDENVNKKRVETALLFLNHNRQGKRFDEKSICKLPFEAISQIIAEVSAMRYEAENDPN